MANFFENIKFWFRGNNETNSGEIGKIKQVIINDTTTEFGITVNNNEEEVYKKISQVQKVVNRKAQMFSSGVWKHYDKNGEEILKSDVLNLLRNPNPTQNGDEFLRQLKIIESIYGDAFVLMNGVLRTTKTLPKGLVNLQSKDVVVKLFNDHVRQTKIENIIRSYEYLQGKNEFLPFEIIKRSYPNPDSSLKGLSPLLALNKEIRNIDNAMDARNTIQGKLGAVGILSSDSKDGTGGIPIDDVERKSIEQQYRKTYGKSDDKLKVLITNASTKWQSISYPLKDLMLFEEVDQNTKAIIDIYGMNENLFSANKAATYNNVLESIKMVLQTTIIPEADGLSQEFSDRFGLTDKGERVVLDYSHLPAMQENEVDKANARKTNAEADIIERGLV